MDGERVWRDAAEKIAAADFLLVAAGAGFSADSGLPVYNDIAAMKAYETLGVDYQDLCNPYWLDDDDEVFYGFWGSCFNDYRDTKHHIGRVRHSAQVEAAPDAEARRPERFPEYVRAPATQWRAAKLPSVGLCHQRPVLRLHFECESIAVWLVLQSRIRPPNSIGLTSLFTIIPNQVDAHFHRSFSKKEIYELHGSVERWQCAGVVKNGDQVVTREPCDEMWNTDAEYRFAVDTETMRASGGAIATCTQCGGKARPNVLMFHDKNWIPNLAEENRYVAWEAVMEQMLEEDPSLRLVVLEIGCGTRVPSVRNECEMVVADLFERCGQRDQASLIRINPDFAHCDHPVLTNNRLVLSIPSRGLEALMVINELLSATQLSSM